MEFIGSSSTRRIFWAPKTSSNYHTDFESGRRYAEQFVAALQKREATPFLLADIVSDFPDTLTPIERGFLSELSYRLAA